MADPNEIRVQDEQGTIHVFPGESTPEMIAKAMNVKPPQARTSSGASSEWTPDPNDYLTKAEDFIHGLGSGALKNLPFIGERLGANYNQQGVMNPNVAQTGEQTGRMYEQGLEMAATGGPLKEAATTIAGKLPFLGKLTAPLMRTGAEALNAAGSAALHNQPMGQAAAIGGGATAAGEALLFIAPWLRKAAQTQYQKALSPTTKINKAIAQDITPELLQRGESGSLEGLNARAGQKLAELNPELNQQYSKLTQGRTVPGPGAISTAGNIKGAGNQIIQDLEDLKQSYQPQGMTAQPQAVSAIEGLQGIVKQYGSDIDPNSLRRLRQIFEEVPAQRGAYAGVDLSTNYTLNAQKAAADSIRSILNKHPDIGTLNKQISFWLDVQRVTGATALRRTGQEGGLLKTLWPLAASVAGGGAGFAAHGTEAGVGAAAATMMATQVAKAMRSPTWRTTSAVVKNQIADSLARGDAAGLSAILGRLGVSTLGTTPRSVPWDLRAQPQGQPQQQRQ